MVQTQFDLMFLIVMIFFLSLLNGQLLFIVKFFGKLVLIFLLEAIIGKLLHHEKHDKSDSQAHS
jgi:hypothetical protein